MNSPEVRYGSKHFSDGCDIEKWPLLVLHMFLILFPFVLREKLIKENE